MRAVEIDPLIAERFELLGVAGAGGMGTVYRARDRGNDRLVALKLLATDGGDGDRFEREADVLALVDHPRVVRYLEHGKTEAGTQFLAMEWLEGCDLAAYLKEGALSLEEALAVTRAIAEALAAAHASGIVHRDLKPANVFLVDRKPEAARLIDFGLARPQAYSSVTVSGVVVGTPAYMAPEQVRGEQLDERVDVYGLGTVLYASLTGEAPFKGAHQIAILAKLVLEAAPSVRGKRPEVPPALDALVARMLAKERGDRPEDMHAVLRELDALESGGAMSMTRAIARSEQRVSCVVLCSTESSAEDVTVVERRRALSLDDIVRAVGGTVHVLARGSVLVSIRGAATPAEQATRAARSALALARARPGSPVAIATGRIVIDGDAHVGEVIDRAAQALFEIGGGEQRGVRVDERTADLLANEFEVTGEGAWRTLVGEREASSLRLSRVGLGACVGRSSEVGALDAAHRSCLDEERARAVLVTGIAGAGKSRVVHEFLEKRADSAFDVRVARGDAYRVGSPFAAVGSILGDSAAERLRALLRNDPSVGLGDVTTNADAVREAFVDWVGSVLAARPLMIVIEDAHWVDGASLRLLEAALSAHAERSVFVVASARPEARDALTSAFNRGGFQELSLGPIPRRAAEGLVRERVKGANDEVVRTVVERAAGHALYLEELVRAVAAGQAVDVLPDTVLGVIQLRLDELDAETRRALRAASLYGERCSAAAVASVLAIAERDAAALLNGLIAKDVLTCRDYVYAFRHALIREAAYDTFTPEDRSLGHRLAADWLIANGEGDAAVLAEHLLRAADEKAAVVYLVRAAKHALDASDLERASAHVARARACGPDPATTGSLAAVAAEIGYWRGDLDAAVEHASVANAHVGHASAEWFAAASAAIGAHGQRGQNDDVARWLGRVVEAPASPSTRSAQAIAMCRGLTQLLWAHHADAAPLRARLESIVATPKIADPFARGWIERVRAEATWLHDADVARAATHFSDCCDAFELARATRYLCLARLNSASFWGWAGDPARASELLARARVDLDRLGSPFLAMYARAVEAMLFVFVGDLRGEAIEREIAAALSSNPRLTFLNRVFAGYCALERGDAATAENDARLAMAVPVVAELRPAGPALLSLALLARGAVEEALAAAREALAIERRADVELTDGLAELALSRALDATGDRAGAIRALEPRWARMRAIADGFRDRRFANDRLRDLAREWRLVAT